jgi:hypothetical protein
MKRDDPEKRIRDLERELADSYHPGQARRKVPVPAWYYVVPLVILVAVAVPLVYVARQDGGNSAGGPITVPPGGAMSVGGSGDNQTITCSDGEVTLPGFNSTYLVTGHCTGLTVSGFDNRVTVDSADAVKITSYGNHVDVGSVQTVQVGNYGNRVTVSGHVASLDVSLYNNQVRVESADTINVSGYSNTVTYHSGTPKVTQSGYDITVRQG